MSLDSAEPRREPSAARPAAPSRTTPAVWAAQSVDHDCTFPWCAVCEKRRLDTTLRDDDEPAGPPPPAENPRPKARGDGTPAVDNASNLGWCSAGPAVAHIRRDPAVTPSPGLGASSTARAGATQTGLTVAQPLCSRIANRIEMGADDDDDDDDDAAPASGVSATRDHDASDASDEAPGEDDSSRSRLLRQCCRTNDAARVRALLASGEVTVADRGGESALHMACRHGSLEVSAARGLTQTPLAPPSPPFPSPISTLP